VQCDNRGQIIDPPQLGRGIALSRVRRHGVLGEEQPRAVGVPCRRSDSSLVLTVLVSGSIIPPEVDDQERSRPVEEWAQDPVLYGYRTGVDDRGDSRTASRVPGRPGTVGIAGRRLVFTERLPELAVKYARRSHWAVRVTFGAIPSL
jgi:hypothetical protein